MRWGQRGPGTRQLPSSMVKVCCPLIPYPMTVRINISFHIFRFCVFTSTCWGYLFLFSSPLLFLPACVHRIALLRNFGQWSTCTSVLDWDLTLVDYPLLRFHPGIPTASVFRVILFSLDWYWEKNWKPLWCFGLFFGSSWNHHLQPKLFSQDSSN